MGDTFVNPFSLIAPSGADLANGIDGYILDGTKKALDERFEQEHYSLSTGADDVDSATGQGRHKAGKVGVWGKGTSVAMRATSGAGTGAFWEITTTDAGTGLPAGTMFRFEVGVGWTDAQFGSGVAYATTAEIASATPPADKAISAATLRQADTKFVPLTTPITAWGDVTIADLVGTGLIPANVRQLHILCYVGAVEIATVYYNGHIKATYPDGVDRVLAEYIVNDNIYSDTSRTGSNLILPIDPVAAPVVTFTPSTFGYNTMSIFAVTQNSYEV